MTTIENEAVEMTDRQRLAASLREYARLIEDNENLPVPYSISVSSYLTEDECRDGRRGTWGWKKQTSKTSAYVSYTKTIGGEQFDRSTISIELSYSKEDSSCVRVQTGTRVVPAYSQEERIEPVYEWQCGSDAPADPPADPTVFGTE